MYSFPVDTIWCSADAEHEEYVPLLQTCVRLSEAGQMQGVSICEYLCNCARARAYSCACARACFQYASYYLNVCVYVCMCVHYTRAGAIICSVPSTLQTRAFALGHHFSFCFRAQIFEPPGIARGGA